MKAAIHPWILYVCLVILPITVQATSTDKLSTDSKSLQMEKLSTGHDVIQASINGVEGLFIVDTGAVTVINDRSLGQFNLTEQLSSHAAAGAGGPIQIDFYAVEDVSISGLKVPIQQVGSTDLNAVTVGLYNATGRLIDGLIGIDVLTAAHARLDVTRNRLEFLAPHANDPTGLSLTIPLKALTFTEMGFTYLALSYRQQNHVGWLLVDSGASRSIINESTWESLEFSSEPLNETQISSGAGGGLSLQPLPLDFLMINHRKFAIDQIFTSDLSAVVDFIHSHTGIQIDGVIGQDFLQKYRAVIDVGRQKLVLSGIQKN